MTTGHVTLRAFVQEPFDLAISQPHQMLISSASVAIVAVEAATLVPWPANIALAVGAEWAYLRGFITGAGVKTRWASALNWSAVALVFGYGTLAGLRSFKLIPESPSVWLAVLLTLIHIGAIGAVTICSAMLHRAAMDADRLLSEKRLHAEEERNRAKVAAEEERNRRLQQAQDDLNIEMRRRDAELRLMDETARRKNQIAAERAQLKGATAKQVAATARNRIIVDGVEYPTVQAAADAHGISRQAMSKRLGKRAR